MPLHVLTVLSSLVLVLIVEVVKVPLSKRYICVSTRTSTVRDVCPDFFFFQAEDGIRDLTVTGVQTCALPISEIEPEDVETLAGPGPHARPPPPVVPPELALRLRPRRCDARTAEGLVAKADRPRRGDGRRLD